MIHLFTGQPGAGKTLYAIDYLLREVEKWHQAHPDKPRQVFYSGIDGLRVPDWIEFEADQWHTLPKGSFVLIDECQRAFRPRHVSQKVPPHVEALETHRHDGFDVFLITQMPGLVDTNVRQLIGLHFHCVRKFGTENSTIHEWPKVHQQPDSQGAKGDSVKHHYRFNKAVFALYKSAEVHTHKRRIPAKVFFLVLAPLMVAAGVWYMVRFYDSKAAQVKPGVAQSSAGVITSGTPQKSPEQMRREWLVDQAPRLPDFPHSAPKYDKVMAAVTAPKPAACVVWPKKGCRCYTQQATRMQMSEDVCRQIVDKGWFDDTLPERGQQIAQVQGQAGQQQPTRPAAAPGQAQATLDAYAASPGPSNPVAAPTPGIDQVRQPTAPLGSTWRAK